MTKREHPSDPRPNKYPARCCHCRELVPAGHGQTEKIMGTPNGWRTYHVMCDLRKNPQDYIESFNDVKS